MASFQWGPLGEADLPALRRLARACLAQDGGLPLLDDDDFLRGRILRGPSTGARDELGDLVACIGVVHDGDGGLTAMGLVHPSYRSVGLGGDLLDFALEHAGGAPVRVVVESLNPPAEDLLRVRGFAQVFAETVMRHDLRGIPLCARPAGLRTYPFHDDTAGLFFAAYQRSFAERPGFPDPTREEWVRDTEEGPGFRADLSRVALDKAGHPVGFVTVSDAWVDQVGVVPEWRGRGLGAHLVARTLTKLAREGRTESWLAVNVDNPGARELYERLGYAAHGTRARYAHPGRVAAMGGAVP
ncbi:MAG TPA: GNAT family N-acetyltransferase [Pedococcus sp.]